MSGREHHGFTHGAGAWVQAAGVGHGSRGRADLWASQRHYGADRERTTSAHPLVPSLVPPACLSAWDLGIRAGSSRGDLGLSAGTGHAQVVLGRMLYLPSPGTYPTWDQRLCILNTGGKRGWGPASPGLVPEEQEVAPGGTRAAPRCRVLKAFVARGENGGVLRGGKPSGGYGVAGFTLQQAGGVLGTNPIWEQLLQHPAHLYTSHL